MREENAFANFEANELSGLVISASKEEKSVFGVYGVPAILDVSIMDCNKKNTARFSLPRHRILIRFGEFERSRHPLDPHSLRPVRIPAADLIVYRRPEIEMFHTYGKWRPEFDERSARRVIDEKHRIGILRCGIEILEKPSARIGLPFGCSIVADIDVPHGVGDGCSVRIGAGNDAIVTCKKTGIPGIDDDLFTVRFVADGDDREQAGSARK